MALNTTLDVSNDIATITLEGELDASTAGIFQEKVQEAAGQDVKKLVLRMEALEYMASAGLRVLIFAKQKMGNDVDIYVVGPQDMVKETIEKTGFHHSVILLASSDVDQITSR